MYIFILYNIVIVFPSLSVIFPCQNSKNVIATYDFSSDTFQSQYDIQGFVVDVIGSDLMKFFFCCSLYFTSLLLGFLLSLFLHCFVSALVILLLSDKKTLNYTHTVKTRYPSWLNGISYKVIMYTLKPRYIKFELLSFVLI